MGGVAGHLNHIQDNLSFTIGEIKGVLKNVADANIEVIEKVDGQNLFFTYDVATGQVMTARNGSDIKKGGMTPAEFSSKWAGHPAERAFVDGFKAIKRGLARLPEEQLASIFTSEDGDVYVNAEIMYVGNPNIINYGANYIVLHNLHTFANGQSTVTSRGAFKDLVNAIEDAEGILDVENWGISGPRTVHLNNLIDGKHYSHLAESLDALGVSDNTSLADYVEDKLRMGIIGNMDIPIHTQEAIIKRIIAIGHGTPSSELPNLRDIKKSVDKSMHKAISAVSTKAGAYRVISKLVSPIEKIISDFAIEVLRGLKSFFLDDHNAEISRMRSELESSITELSSYKGDDAEKMGQLLDKNLTKLASIENVASTLEGIVFEHPPGSEVLYKLTGAFAMVNQIVGRARRMPKEVSEARHSYNLWDLMKEDAEFHGSLELPTDSETVAIIPGAFKPPHLGHVKMVEHYSALADRVIVIISTPKDKPPKRLKSGKLSKAKVKSSKRFVGDKEVTSEMSKKMFEAMISHVDNAEVRISPLPSPVSVAFKMVEEDSELKAGTNIILGSSIKGGDIARFEHVRRTASDKFNILDPKANAAPAASIDPKFISLAKSIGIYDDLPSQLSGKDSNSYHASDLRYLLSIACESEDIKELVGYYVGAQAVNTAIGTCSTASAKERPAQAYLPFSL